MAIEELTTRDRVIILRALMPCLTATKIAAAARVSRERVRQLLNLAGDDEWLNAAAGRDCWDEYPREAEVLAWIEDGTLNIEQAAGLLADLPSVQKRLAVAKERIIHVR